MIGLIRSALLQNKLAIIPTDTVYGIVCNAFCFCAKQKIFLIKKRSTKKQLPLMFSSIDSIKRFADLDTFQEGLIQKLLPGPFTFVVKSKPHLKHFLPKKIAVRVPDCKVTLKILKKIKFPVAATSTNISGKKEVKNANELTKYPGRKVCYVLHSDKKMLGTSSTIIDICEGVPKVLRMAGDDTQLLTKLRSLQD